MPHIQLSPGVTLNYRENDFTDPWKMPEAVLMLHGFSESGKAWNEWVPHLARRFRVIRPDMRGFGESTPMPLDHDWSPEEIIGDYLKLMDHLGIEKFHLVGAKIGGALSYRMAANYPERVLSITAMGSRTISGRKPMHGRAPAMREMIEKEGVEVWARHTMPGRLGPNCSPEFFEGWTKLMVEATPASTQLGFMMKIPGIDSSIDLPKIKCPTLVIVNEGNIQAPVEEAAAGVKMIPRGEMFVLPGDSWHVAVTHANECAEAMLAFLDRSAVAV